MSTVERKYQLTRITAGDYLLPSNDARTLYRIASYVEDGSLSYTGPGGREQVVRGTYWSVARWHTGLPTDADVQSDEFLSWGPQWVNVETLLPTRSAAIKAAL